MKHLLEFILALLRALARKSKINNETTQTHNSNCVESDYECSDESVSTRNLDIPGKTVSSISLDVSDETVRSRSPDASDETIIPTFDLNSVNFDRVPEDLLGDVDFSIFENVCDDLNIYRTYDMAYEQYFENSLLEAKQKLKQELFDELWQKITLQMTELQSELQKGVKDYDGVSRYTNIARIILDIIRLWIEFHK